MAYGFGTCASGRVVRLGHGLASTFGELSFALIDLYTDIRSIITNANMNRLTDIDASVNMYSPTHYHTCMVCVCIYIYTHVCMLTMWGVDLRLPVLKASPLKLSQPYARRSTRRLVRIVSSGCTSSVPQTPSGCPQCRSGVVTSHFSLILVTVTQNQTWANVRKGLNTDF